MNEELNLDLDPAFLEECEALIQRILDPARLSQEDAAEVAAIRAQEIRELSEIFV